MPVSTKEVEVSISYGVFNVTYGRYYAGTKSTYDDPGDSSDVDIVDISFVDPEEEYEDTVDGFMQDDDFLEELKEEVIQRIIEDSYCAAEARYEADYEDRLMGSYRDEEQE